MKRCPKCGTAYPDEANFCPTDACRLDPVPGAAAASQAAAGPADGDDRATEVSPTIAGRFRLGERLANGRTGEVFDATDMSDGGRCVVKAVAAGVFDTALLMQRAERELKQLERLNAPGVARVVAHGRQEDRLWIAMEKVDGIALDAIVEEAGRIAPERAAQLAMQVASALAEAARFGVIHRDLAPKNVLVGEGDSVSLINFGVPVPVEGKSPGVPEFVSPEQIGGKPVDQRSNIYSLGALLYFCATGAPPYRGEDVEAVYAQHLSDAPPPAPSSRVAAIPAAFDALVLKALERSSSKRQMTMRQLVRDLEQLGDGPASTKPMGRAGVQAAAAKGKPSGKQGKNKALAGTLLGVAPLGGGGEAAGQRPVGPGGAVVAQSTIDTALGLRRALAVDPTAETAANEAIPPAKQERPAEAGAVPVRPDRAVRPAAVVVEEEAPPQEREDSVASTTDANDPSKQQNASGAPSEGAASGAGQAPAAPSSPAGRQSAPANRPQPPGQPAAAGGKAKRRRSGRRSAKRGGFRETMWFKKGKLDEQAAAQAAAVATSGQDDAPVSDKADELPIEDRYVDDGSLTHQDQSQFSLRTGSTQMVPALREGGFGGNVSEKDLVSEMRGGRGKLIVLIIIAVLAVTALVAYLTA